MSKTRQGTEKEREVRHIYEAAGYDVIRAAASKGGADLVASNRDRVVFIQVKKTSQLSKVRAAAVRELQAIPTPITPHVLKRAWIYVKQSRPGEHPEGWHVLGVKSGGWHACDELATLLSARGPTTEGDPT